MFNNGVHAKTLLGPKMGPWKKIRSILSGWPGRVTNRNDSAFEYRAKTQEPSPHSAMDIAKSTCGSTEATPPEDSSLAVAHFNRGVLLLESDRPLLALEAFGLALLSKPQSAGTYYNIGNAHLALGNFAAAIAAYNTAISYKAEFPDAEAALLATYYQRDVHSEQLFQQAVICQERGDLERAAVLYRTVLTLTPSRAEACSNLGAILFHNERPDEALVHFQQAASYSPNSADIQANLGNIYRFLNQHENARLCYEKSVQLDAANPKAWLQLGELQRELGLYRDALTSFARSIALDENLSEAHLSMCVTFIALDDYASAEVCCSRAIDLEPDNPAALSNLGAVFRRRGRFSDALDCFRRALALNPAFFEAHLNSGTVYMALGQFPMALQAYQNALAINPLSAEALSNCGAVLLRLERTTEAEASLQKALAICPNLATALNNLGLVFSTTRRMDQAVLYFNRAIENKSDYVDAYANLGGVLKDMGRLEEALRTLRQALSIDPNCLIAHSNLLLVGSYTSDQPVELLLSEARQYGEAVARLATPYSDWQNSPSPERTLRIGFISGDFCCHPVGYFLDSVLKQLISMDVPTLEIFAYASRQSDDVMSHRLRSYCASWQCVVGVSDEELAKRIHDHDHIDILIDLAGHTANNRLAVFAWKPAPIQVTWLGYFATTGVRAIDYILADPLTLPLDQEAYFSEQVWRLPETRLCFSPPDVMIDVNSLPALSRGFVTFGCFNNLSKMNDEVVRIWALILASVPLSRLFLKYQQLGDSALRLSTLARFAAHGITPDRLILEDYGPRSEYLGAYHRVDICLDPFPFPGGTTTAEALWMGVPVLTLSGKSFLSRQGVGLLTNSGLSDWVAQDIQDYLSLAVFHAGQLRSLAYLRSQLRQRVLRSPIFDAERFAGHFQMALRSMWRSWCNQSSSTALED